MNTQARSNSSAASSIKPPAIKIAPSILSGDFANLKQELHRLNKTTCAYIHLDVMDGHFVNNLTFGAPMIKALRPHTDKVFDVHLMISEPEKYLEAFIAAGSDIISIHREVAGDVIGMLKVIRQAGKRASLAFNPDTSTDDIEIYFPYVDQILLMSVHPGFSDQKLIPSVLDKGRQIYAKMTEYQRTQRSAAEHLEPIDLEIDGGVNDTNIASVAESGFNVIVSGGYIFKADDLALPIRHLEQAFS